MAVRRGYARAAAAGIAAVVLGAGVGELAAAFGASASSPFAAIGGTVIDAAPPWAKDAVIALFGTGDKAALLTGIAIVLLAVAAVAGLLQARWPPTGRIVCLLLGAAGVIAAVHRPDATSLAWAPSAIAGICAALAIGPLVRLAAPQHPASQHPAAPQSAAPSPPQAGTQQPGGIRMGEPLPPRPPAAFDASPSDGPRTRGGSAPARSTPSVTRRDFFAWTAAAALVGVAAAAVGTAMQSGSRAVTAIRKAVHLPKAVDTVPVPASASFDVPGITPAITSNADFYRIDTALVVPQVDPDTWSLRIHGLVDHELTLTWPQLLALPLSESATTLSCVSNEVGGDLISTAIWLGHPIRELLARVGVHPDADMVLSRSVDGFTASTPLEALTDPHREAILAVGMNGQPLPAEHGFPVRMVVPGLYGYVSATKWITELEVTRFDRASAYWTERGWSERGPVKLQSRIDVPRRGEGLSPGETVIAGVAWQQHVGVSKVEVQVDGGEWRQATLATAISDDTWVQWSIPWTAERGSHAIRCRATNAHGETQTSTDAWPAPDGATGWQQLNVQVG